MEQTELFFSNTYDDPSLFLLEIPEQVYEDFIIKSKGELIIKGEEPTVICTNDKSYELKSLETSNTFMVIDNECKSNDTNVKGDSGRKDIKLMTYHTVVCDEFSPKKYHMYNMLKKNCALEYDLETGHSNFGMFPVKYTRMQCFAMSDLPKDSFDAFLNQNSIFEKDGYMCMFKDSFVNNILYYILKSIALVNLDVLDCLEDIYEQLDKVMLEYNKVTQEMTLIEKKILLTYAFDYDESEKKYKLSLDKALLFLSKVIFFANDNISGQFTVNSYISLLQNCLNISLPYQTLSALVERSETYLLTSNCQDNLFEYYKEYDFRYLIGHCAIYVTKASKEPLIKWIDKTGLAERFEKRVSDLFSIKDKWTPKELNLFMKDLEISNFHEKITRLTQMVTEVNPFNKEKQVTYLYIKKNPFYKSTDDK